MSLDKLPYLIDEICAAVEIYYTGRQGGQYLKTAFVLCDDYTELTAKLFLLADNRHWSDTKDNGRFKNYHEVLVDVENVFQNKFPAELSDIQTVQNHFKERRDRRNDFFHSTHLLDLGANPRGVVEAFCDLFTYGELLFKENWQSHIKSSRNLETMHILLLIEKASFSDPTVWGRAMDIIHKWPRNKSNAARKGVHITEYPEDFHLRLSILHGSNILRDKLKAVLPESVT